MYVLNDSLAHINILYKYDDATLIYKHGHMIALSFNSSVEGISRMQGYLIQHVEYHLFHLVAYLCHLSRKK